MNLILILLSVYISTASSFFCYWNSGCPYKYFASKTPYNNVRGDIRDSIKNLKGCEPISIWGIMRHGKRNPNNIFGENMKNAFIIRDYVVTSYKNKNSSLCAQDIQNLKNWIPDSKMFNESGNISNEGYEEMEGIGSRMKEAFSELLTDLKEGSYLFRPAFGDRMNKSAVGFCKGLANGQLVIEKAVGGNDVMAPYANCGKYQQDIKRNPATFNEMYNYMKTGDYLAAKDRIHRRLGLNYTLSDNMIESLYDLCRYTWSGVENKFSPWCALFTTEDLKVMEYVDDLRHYYVNSYGTPINEKFGHIPMTDLLKIFQDARGPNGRKITTYFTHSCMLNMIYSALNIFKDDPPLNGSIRNPARKWRASVLAAFSSNLFAVLYRCNKNGAEDNNVVFYLNEEPLLSICRQGVCSWQEFEDKLKPFQNTTIDFSSYKEVKISTTSSCGCRKRPLRDLNAEDGQQCPSI